MWRCQTSIGLHKPIWMNLEWMIHRISQPPSYPSNTFGKSVLTKVLLGGLLCLLLQLLKQRNIPLNPQKEPSYILTYWLTPIDASAKRSKSATWSKNNMNHAATCWNHYEICHFQCQYSKKTNSTATEAGAVCSNSERRLILRLNLDKFPDHEITTNQSLDWKRLRRRI